MTVSLAEATAAARRIQAMGFAQFEHDGREFYDAGRLLAGFVLAGQDCDGSSDCAAAVHVHGCFADDGKCDEPNEHGLAGDTERLREQAAYLADLADDVAGDVALAAAVRVMRALLAGGNP